MVTAIKLSPAGDQSVNSNIYTLLKLETVNCGDASLLGTPSGVNAPSKAIMPPAGLVHFSGIVWLQAGAATSNGTFVAKVVKNSTFDANLHQQVYVHGAYDIGAGIGSNGSLPGTAPIPFSVIDIASPGDYYNLVLYATSSGGNVTVNGHLAHTHMSVVCYGNG